MKIIWTYEALGQLTEIEDFISKDSAERAARFVDQIIEHVVQSLTDNPRIGRAVPEVANPDVRELIFRKYRIVYKFKENSIEILTVFEGHRLLRIDEIGL
ncbi:MAG TPA: type II toxin-antitoxin system RelE/ParE family toxin [Geobacteraceae bacterium]|nr:type II toxin-antitoxin system RelE/ParE family toxin [Geobacteraceae bacterium]